MEKICRQIGSHLRYCVGKVPVPVKAFKCELCEKSYDTKTGLGVHRQHSHKVEYNQNLPTKRVFTWEYGEIEALAREELEIRRSGTPCINISLQRKFHHRTVEGIATVRKKQRYREALEKAAEVEARRTHEESRTPIPSGENESELTVNIPNTVPNEWWTDDNSLEAILEQTPSESESLVKRWKESMERASHPSEADELVKNYVSGITSWQDCKVGLVKLVPGRVRMRKTRTQTIMNRRENRNTAKYRKFRFLQRQYSRQRKSTVSRIVNGKFSFENLPEEYPTVENIETVYVSRLENERRSDESVVHPTEQVNSGYGSISKADIEHVRKSMDKDTAPGPDNVKMADVESIDISHLQIIFNMWWWQGIPVEEKECRTTLIHKAGDRTSMDNWRPITIGNILLRMYAKVWDARLRKNIELDQRQKAFIPADGCYENVKILKTVMKRAKKARQELNLVFLDMAKAFDTVQHESIVKALQRKCVPGDVIDLIRDMYSNSTTVISTPECKTRKIEINAGVKQGCPLSPLLFNLLMDELLCEIRATNLGVKVADEPVGLWPSLMTSFY